MLIYHKTMLSISSPTAISAILSALILGRQRSAGIAPVDLRLPPGSRSGGGASSI